MIGGGIGVVAGRSVLVNSDPALLPFITKWNLPSGTFFFPLSRSITYVGNHAGAIYAEIDWGDGSNVDVYDKLNGEIQASHNYQNSGVYDISISGISIGIFNSSLIADRSSILEIVQWGAAQWQFLVNSFSFMPNLKITALDYPDLSLVSTMKGCFTGSGVDNVDLSGSTASLCTTIQNMFQVCASLISVSMPRGMLSLNSSFLAFRKSSIVDCDFGSDDLPELINASRMFDSCFSLETLNIGYMAKISTLEKAFIYDSSFISDISQSINFSTITNLDFMFFNTKIGVQGYDNMLIKAAESQMLNSGVFFRSFSLNYSAAAVASRQSLISNFGWVISDAGQV